MDQIEKIMIFQENMDVDEEKSNAYKVQYCGQGVQSTYHPDVTYAKIPGGGQIPLLKTMVSSFCEKNCNYCAFRSGRDFQRIVLTPDELAETFLKMVNKNVVKGLFLSSGIIGKGIYSQDKIIATAEILRKKKKFQGYLHLKIMPGAEKDQIRELMKYADRVSINLESPNPTRLETLAPKKDFFNEIFTRLQWISDIKTEEEAKGGWKNRWPSITTQFVVGPAQENDQELINASAFLFQNLHLARVYYMAFKPVINTPFENIPAENPLREHRLYQASFLLRDYGFQSSDFYTDSSGNLSLENDPKTDWANKNLLCSPIEINRASRDQLLRIPGIGPARAKKIMDFRRSHLIRSQNDLKYLGISDQKSGRFILLDGKQISTQLKLF